MKLPRFSKVEKYLLGVVSDQTKTISELQAERDGLAAQVQAIRGLSVKHARCIDQHALRDLDAILAQSPADALAAHDAKVWDEARQAVVD